MSNKDGGPAFPQHGWTSSEETQKRMQDLMGMSLRDWFAGMALQGMLSADGHHQARWSSEHTCCLGQPGGGKWIDPEGVTKQAFEIADAMLEARERKS